MLMIVTLFTISLIGGVLSGLLGVGGAVVLIPLMLSVPPLIGVGILSMHQVTGLTMIQVLAASITGCLTHRRNGFSERKTMLYIGIPMGICSLGGAVASKLLSEDSIMMLFGIVVFLAMLLLMRKAPEDKTEDASENIPFSSSLFILTGAVVGIFSGIVGAGGGFILIPIMVMLLKIPTRVAVGSSLGIVFLAAITGSLGKIITLQVEWLYVIPVILGSVPGVRMGAVLSAKIPPLYLRRILLLVIFVVLVKTWFSIIIN